MADENTSEEETASEREEAAETGATPVEAHREGEFNDIVARLDSLTAKLDSVQSALASIIIDSAGAPEPAPAPAVDLADIDSWDW